MNGYGRKSRKNRVEEDVEDNNEDEEMEEDKGVANADLTLDIVAKAAKLLPRQVSLPFEDDGLAKENLIFISSSDEGADNRSKQQKQEDDSDSLIEIFHENVHEIIDITDSDAEVGNDAAVTIPDDRNTTAEVTSKKKKRKRKKKKMDSIKDMVDIQKLLKQDRGKISNNDADIKDQDQFNGAENMAVRDLLRPRRYFDPPEDRTCFSCGKTGHIASECSNQHPRPCYICGKFEHKGKNCPKMSECHYCGNSGHKAKACPQKKKAKDDGVCELNEQSCLHCGENGHDMAVCRKDYHPDDLKMVKCYICKQSGHLCCRNILGNFKGDVSCYNCGELGHSGMGCAKSRNATENPADDKASQECYKCGEKGHFARGCMNTSNKRKRWPEPWDLRNFSSGLPWLPAQPPQWMGIQTTQLTTWNNAGAVSYNTVVSPSGYFAGLGTGYLYQNHLQQSIVGHQNLLSVPNFPFNAAYQTNPLNKNIIQPNIYERWRG